MRFDQRAIRDYLLGRLPEEKAVEVDDCLFEDQALSLALQYERDCLIEDFAEGRLSRDEEEAFRAQCVRSPVLQAEVQSFRTLLKSIRRRAEPHRWWELRSKWMLIPVAGGLAAVLATFALLFQPSQRSAQRHAALHPQVAPASHAPTPDTVVFLSAIVPRGSAELPQVTIPQDALQVDIEVELRGSSAQEGDWHAELFDGGQIVREFDHLPRERVGSESFLRMLVDAKSLTSGLWSVRFYPGEKTQAVETRLFRLSRKPTLEQR